MPALSWPSTHKAVSVAPHSVPLTYHVCCMRVSLESGVDSTSLWAGSGGLKSTCQQPGPNGVGDVVLLMHCPSGMSPGFWSDFGGNT